MFREIGLYLIFIILFSSLICPGTVLSEDKTKNTDLEADRIFQERVNQAYLKARKEKDAEEKKIRLARSFDSGDEYTEEEKEILSQWKFNGEKFVLVSPAQKKQEEDKAQSKASFKDWGKEFVYVDSLFLNIPVKAIAEGKQQQIQNFVNQTINGIKKKYSKEKFKGNVFITGFADSVGFKNTEHNKNIAITRARLIEKILLKMNLQNFLYSLHYTSYDGEKVLTNKRGVEIVVGVRVEKEKLKTEKKLAGVIIGQDNSKIKNNNSKIKLDIWLYGVLFAFIAVCFCYLFSAELISLPSVPIPNFKEINYLRIIVAGGLVFIGIGFFYLHTQKPKIKKTDFLVNETIKIKSGTDRGNRKNGQLELIRPGFYDFTLNGYGDKSSSPYKILFIGKQISFLNTSQRAYDGTNWQDIENCSRFAYPLYIEKADTFNIRFENYYVSNLGCKITVKEQAGTPKKYFLYLEPDRYNSYKVYVKKGMNFPFTSLLVGYYIDFFDMNGQLIKSHKIQYKKFNPFSNMFSTKMSNRTDFNLFFEQDGYLQFKSMDESFWKVFQKTNMEMLYVNNQVHGEAKILKPGEIHTTRMWLDPGDDFSVYSGNFQFSVGEDKFRSEKKYKIRKSGYLKIKAVNQAVLNKIKFKRHSAWRFTLKPEQVYKIKVHPGDRLAFESNYRFYIDGQLQDLGEFTYTFNHEREIVLKGYNRQAKVYIKVLERRGM